MWEGYIGDGHAGHDDDDDEGGDYGDYGGGGDGDYQGSKPGPLIRIRGATTDNSCLEPFCICPAFWEEERFSV